MPMSQGFGWLSDRPTNISRPVQYVTARPQLFISNKSFQVPYLYLDSSPSTSRVAYGSELFDLICIKMATAQLHRSESFRLPRLNTRPGQKCVGICRQLFFSPIGEIKDVFEKAQR